MLGGGGGGKEGTNGDEPEWEKGEKPAVGERGEDKGGLKKDEGGRGDPKERGEGDKLPVRLGGGERNV